MECFASPSSLALGHVLVRPNAQRERSRNTLKLDVRSVAMMLAEVKSGALDLGLERHSAQSLHAISAYSKQW